MRSIVPLVALALLPLITSAFRSSHLKTFRPPPLTLQTANDGSGLTHEICSRAVDRLIHRNVDFNEIIEANTGQWTDDTFTFPDAIFWKDMRPSNPVDDQSKKASTTEAVRLSEVFDEWYSLWGYTQISPKDAIQGYLGDCWMHAAAAVVAKDPKRVKKIFLTEGINTAGVYALQLYMLGIPVSVTIDEYLLFEDKSDFWDWGPKYELVYA